MKRNKIAIVVYIIIAFAAIGFVSQLFGNTRNFLLSIVLMVGIAAGMFALLKFFINRRTDPSSNEMKKYKQAVKQTKVRYRQPERKSTTPSKPRHTAISGRRSKRRSSHLRVIEGNKSKRKDSASS